MSGSKTPTLPTEVWGVDRLLDQFPTIKKQWVYDTRYENRPPGIIARNVGGKLVFDPVYVAEWWAAGAPKARPPDSLGRRVNGKLVWDLDELAKWWKAGAPRTWPPEGGG
jgi:hypothetical protein